MSETDHDFGRQLAADMEKFMERWESFKEWLLAFGILLGKFALIVSLIILFSL